MIYQLCFSLMALFMASSCVTVQKTGQKSDQKSETKPESNVASAYAPLSAAVYPLPDLEFKNPDQLHPLLMATKGAQVVQLGESLHVTNEIASVRVKLVRALHERAHYDVLALEGSAVDAWLAMDELLQKAGKKDRVKVAQRMAFFGLWQTEAMSELVQIVTDSLKTMRPLYLTSMDSQMGIGAEWRSSSSSGSSSNRDEVHELAEALSRYGVKDSKQKVIQALTPLTSLRSCFQHHPLSKQQFDEISKSIDQLDGWVKEVSPAVQSAHSFVPHAQMLELLPQNLTKNLNLCLSADAKTYQEVRDSQNAESAMMLQSKISRTKKIVIWAHHSHVNYNSLGEKIATMGQVLKKRLGSKLFTLGTFALEGEAMVGQEEPVRQKLRTDASLQALLVSLSDTNYFIDLRNAAFKGAHPELDRKETIQVENVLWPTIFDRDYDSAIILRRVTVAKLNLK